MTSDLKFFKNSNNVPPQIKLIIQEFIRRDSHEDLIEGFESKYGIPVWNLAFNVSNSKKEQNSLTSLDSSIIIPVITNGESEVKSYIKATISDSIILEIHTADQYNNFGFSTTTSLINEAEKLAVRFMYLNKMVFGDSSFNITDKRLFHGSNKYSDTNSIKREILLHQSTSSNIVNSFPTESNLVYHSICVDVITITYTSYHCPVPGACNGPGGTCDRCLEVCATGSTSTQTICDGWWEDDGGSGGTTPPPGPGPGTGGGGGGTGTGPTGCPPGIVASVIPPCGGGGGGWVPITPIDDHPPFVPYVCNYQMNQHEIEVFNEINEEDNLADQQHQNLDCQGTKRTGNVKFQGTKEHWLIELDYVSKNPTYGEAEFAIPQSSGTNPNNRGYADIVNLQNGDIFEIKPPTQLQSGLTEVNNYVSKANQYCNTTLPFGTSWRAGSTYQTTFLPTSVPNVYLKSEKVLSGVLIYSYVNLTNPNPVPVPIVVPNSLIDKFRQLIDRLRGNAGIADRVIAEYLHENPDLVNYIKSAAIGAGVAIVVGTILEDILTLGAGFGDDWVCFVLAYRIIRFGIKL